eukprot:jgi/Psemu1/36768/gm1.36768_g
MSPVVNKPGKGKPEVSWDTNKSTLFTGRVNNWVSIKGNIDASDYIIGDYNGKPGKHYPVRITGNQHDGNKAKKDCLVRIINVSDSEVIINASESENIIGAGDIEIITISWDIRETLSH